MITAATNLVLRHPGRYFQPYAGVGVGLFFARASDAQASASDVSPGLSALAGARIFLGEQVAVFGEAKYNRATLDFSNGSQYAIRHTYDAVHFIVGLSGHFGR